MMPAKLPLQPPSGVGEQNLLVKLIEGRSRLSGKTFGGQRTSEAPRRGLERRYRGRGSRSDDA
jgi:hypothetical protein